MAYLIKGKTGDWELVIGLETHIELLSQSKLFSSASADYKPSAQPNTQVSAIDAAMPGMLPSLNKECVRQAIKMGLGLNAEISKKSRFARKQYFYPDLPSGYQISQPANEPPIVGRGCIEIIGEDGEPKKVFIERAHLEQDAGKAKHDAHPNKTYVDLNRAGVALLEIVTFLDTAPGAENSFIESPGEAERYLREIRSIARALGISNANMEEGSMRADVNVSVRPAGSMEFRTRTETKNMVSFKFIKSAIEYEAKRQIAIYESGGLVSQDTMRYNQAEGTTSVMRSKEDALDYRYFPDPDLLPLIITGEEIEVERRKLPELPSARRKRYADFGLAAIDANRIGEDSSMREFFESVIAGNSRRAKHAANWILGDLAAIPEYEMRAQHLAELVDMLLSDEISSRNAKDIFAKMTTGEAGSPREISEKYGFRQSGDTAAIEAAIDAAIAANADALAQYRAGKTGLLGFFVGQVMKATGGSANPKAVNELLLKKIIIGPPSS
ncbi:MAG: Asp-tRNA(Asn)/Glu-tRNA(Gln) amidotransferase subunit GatB [Rickettsiales bacterium]|jgi:aspartyl-tRNA(Asn)/glutamyl-tRNA(Gln) amidotransferase subunit B|nr:Asp-tRNA(Asn)/Glu-tRNA(Gln) amidotransferase subunit GatB [Rickettsiales bacterium]